MKWFARKKCYITIFDTLILRYKKAQSAVMAILGLLQLCKYVMHQWWFHADRQSVTANSLRVASSGPPTASCVLTIARTFILQAPPTFRGRGWPPVRLSLSVFRVYAAGSSAPWTRRHDQSLIQFFPSLAEFGLYLAFQTTEEPVSKFVRIQLGLVVFFLWQHWAILGAEVNRFPFCRL